MSVIAQPWLKPASTIRPAGMPRAFSRAISASTSACDSRSPALVLALLRRVETEAEDVVPGAHDVAAVDRHRPRRRVRKDEAHRADGAEVELVRDRNEVVAVRAQAVQDDHGGARVGRGDEFDRFEVHASSAPCKCK